MIRRYRAPIEDGRILCDPPWDALPDLVLRSHASSFAKPDHRRELIEAAQAYHRERGELLPESDPASPLLMGGHQPELFHAGVWAKNFALAGLAKRVRGTVVNLVVDQDLLKSATLKLPTLGAPNRPDLVSLQTLAFDEAGPTLPYELRRIQDFRHFASFPHHVLKQTHDWPFAPMLPDLWSGIAADDAPTIGERFAAMRRRVERCWGVANLELPVSRLATLTSFAEFVAAIEDRLSEFRAIYNASLQAYRKRHRLRSKDHPAPELAPGERPFWRIAPTGRERPMRSYPAHELRPRALTLTLYVRRMLADFFLHGLGGGLYDEVTDDIARRFFDRELPPYGVFTLTSRLPLSGYPTTPADLRAAVRHERDKIWNPQRFFPPFAPERQAFDEMLRADQSTKRARRDRFRRLRDIKGMLRPAADDVGMARLRVEVQANALLHRRESAWVLYPEAFLQPRLTAWIGDGE